MKHDTLIVYSTKEIEHSTIQKRKTGIKGILLLNFRENQQSVYDNYDKIVS